MLIFVLVAVDTVHTYVAVLCRNFLSSAYPYDIRVALHVIEREVYFKRQITPEITSNLHVIV